MRNLLDLTHDTIFVRDRDDVITYWNRAATEALWLAGRGRASAARRPQLLEYRSSPRRSDDNHVRS